MNGLVSVVALSLVLGAASLASAEPTIGGVKSVWGKALKNGSTISLKGMSKLQLTSSARAQVKAGLKKPVFFGPTEKTILTLGGKGQVAKKTFAVHINAPGFDTGSSDFVAHRLTKIFDRATGKLRATYNLTWDGERTLFAGWEK